MTARPTQSTPKPRGIRVFVSSTFSDMHAERDELVLRIFPQLRKLCEQRGITWGEVDLRWGITDEKRAEGKVLPICLAEVHRCRPYFIGLLGGRYGSVPAEIPPELIKQEPWLAEHLHHSVTALEILHGVLNNPDMAGHAFFYLRTPKFVDSVPEKQRPNFLERPTEEDIKKYGKEEAIRRAEERRQRLESLKDRIRKSNLPVKEDYKDPQHLGQLVLADLTRLINQLFPPQPLDPLEREALENQAFAESRTRVYIMEEAGKTRYFSQLDAHVKGDGPPLVIQGESGSGKSALLANWAGHYLESHKNAHLIMHFIGASPYSADWAAMLRRIMGELKRRFGIQQDIPDKPDQLRLAFANFLSMASASAEKDKEKIILILDALNQLEDRDQAPDLVWLPPDIPQNVRLILSTLPGRPMDALRPRNWPSLTVETLNEEERRQFIVQYLQQYSRELAPSHLMKIASAPKKDSPRTANPLYLQTLLEELRVYGDHKTLEGRIDHYLEAETVEQLYRKVIERWEGVYDRDRPGLVREAMSLVWASRRGLSEIELTELLGTKGTPLPSAYWSPLYLAAETLLVNRSGLIGFFHDYLRKAVRARYLATEKGQQQAHLLLAGYFDKHRLAPRAIDELPWQLAEAREWKQLYHLLSDLPFFDSAYKANKFEVMTYWSQVETNSTLNKVNAYGPILNAPDRYEASYVKDISILFYETGSPEQALLLESYLAEYFRKNKDDRNLTGCLNDQALILKDRGELDRALELYKEQERLCREQGDKQELSISLGNQAVIHYLRGELDKAMGLHKEQERLCRELGYKQGLAISLGNQANIHYARGELDRAMELYKEAEQICRERGYKIELSNSLGNQANIHYARGELDKAMGLHKEQERLCRELGNKQGLAISLGNQATIHYTRGELDRAMELYKEEEQICRELGNKQGLAISLGNQANLLAGGLGRVKEALPLAEEAYQIATRCGLNALAGQIRPILDKIHGLYTRGL